MNAITKTLAPRIFIRPLAINLPVPKRHIFVLFVAVLIMAVSVVYMKDLNRRLFINYQDVQQTSMDLNTTHSKLLLEGSALSAQARVQRVAAEQLSMQIPTTANEKMITL